MRDIVEAVKEFFKRKWAALRAKVDAFKQRVLDDINSK
jgi:hypothetical protein